MNRGDWEPEELLRAFENEIRPAIGTTSERRTLARDLSEVDQTSLEKATASLRPDPNLPRSDEVYAALQDLVAERASLENGDSELRFVAAAGWLCQNFRKFIWWDCD